METVSRAADCAAYWDRTENVVAGCHVVEHSCLNCYAVSYAAGIHTANDVELYRGTTELKHGRKTWSGLLRVKPLNDPTYTIPLTWQGAKEPVMGPGKPSIFWANSMADPFDPMRFMDARASPERCRPRAACNGPRGR